jgi:hypothetical protein
MGIKPACRATSIVVSKAVSETWNMVSQKGLDSRSHVLLAAIDEHVLSSELEQLRVTLAYVDEVNGEILTHRYCCRDGNQQDCEKSYLQESLKIGLFYFHIPSDGLL